jgi:hypothetical protein
MKIPVLHLYRQLNSPVSLTSACGNLLDVERGFWDDSKWMSAWYTNREKALWFRETLCVIDFGSKEKKFKTPDDLARWIWRDEFNAGS